MATKKDIRKKKAQKLIEQQLIKAFDNGEFLATGSKGNKYLVEIKKGTRPSCTCPSSAIWRKSERVKYGAYTCYHIEAAAQLVKQQ
jgi:hypothetical protein